MDELTAKDVALLVLGMTVTILWAFIVIFYVEWWRLKRTLNPPWADPRVPEWCLYPYSAESYNKGRRHKMPQQTGRNLSVDTMTSGKAGGNWKYHFIRDSIP
ncbi:hypothetical protein N7530_011172, partial [Penicillium desertorum]